MRRALELARRGEGRVEPNPVVGAVIVDGDRVVAEGWHDAFGGPHAELVTLEAAFLARQEGRAGRGFTPASVSRASQTRACFISAAAMRRYTSASCGCFSTPASAE
jgi:pyrimidine deaminase RibD-like protein